MTKILINAIIFTNILLTAHSFVILVDLMDDKNMV